MSDTWWARTDRDIVAVGGVDARDYLQGQISQDVAAMAVGDDVWSFVLAPQGKVDAWFRLHAVADGAFVADLDAGYGSVFIERIERFRLRVDVELEMLDWQYASVRGPDAARPEQPDRGLVAAVDWPGFSGFDVMGPVVEPPEGVQVVDTAHFDRARIAVGWPAMGRELTEKTIPAEAGIVDRSVSFTKGCYTGQELVARIDSRGNNTPKRLCRLRSDGELAVGADVTADGSKVGTITSAAPPTDHDGSVALAYLHRSVELPALLFVDGVSVSALDG